MERRHPFDPNGDRWLVGRLRGRLGRRGQEIHVVDGHFGVAKGLRLDDRREEKSYDEDRSPECVHIRSIPECPTKTTAPKAERL